MKKDKYRVYCFIEPVCRSFQILIENKMENNYIHTVTYDAKSKNKCSIYLAARMQAKFAKYYIMCK